MTVSLYAGAGQELSQRIQGENWVEAEVLARELLDAGDSSPSVNELDPESFQGILLLAQRKEMLGHWNEALFFYEALATRLVPQDDLFGALWLKTAQISWILGEQETLESAMQYLGLSPDPRIGERALVLDFQYRQSYGAVSESLILMENFLRTHSGHIPGPLFLQNLESSLGSETLRGQEIRQFLDRSYAQHPSLFNSGSRDWIQSWRPRETWTLVRGLLGSREGEVNEVREENRIESSDMRIQVGVFSNPDYANTRRQYLESLGYRVVEESRQNSGNTLIVLVLNIPAELWPGVEQDLSTRNLEYLVLRE